MCNPAALFFLLRQLLDFFILLGHRVLICLLQLFDSVFKVELVNVEAFLLPLLFFFQIVELLLQRFQVSLGCRRLTLERIKVLLALFLSLLFFLNLLLLPLVVPLDFVVFLVEGLDEVFLLLKLLLDLLVLLYSLLLVIV